ncbi:MAG: hypothetical protein K0R65_860 [Crocinitomicaceae bacterium]|jgi:hypothetical protein|nr:hypothetical protein [Crocinitomicaceae bacterium]
MKTIIILSAILVLSCSGNSKIVPQPTKVDIAGKTYVDFFDGMELNKLIFSKSSYVYFNREMEVEEYGHYQYDLNNHSLRIKQDSIKHPSGEIEIDRTNFIVELPNDTTLVFTTRIEYFSRNKEYSTKKLNHVMYLKR